MKRSFHGVSISNWSTPRDFPLTGNSTSQVGNSSSFHENVRGGQPFNVFVEPFAFTYHVNIKDAIENIGEFDNAVRALRMASEFDEVIIHMNCVGGALHETTALIHAMNQCKAHIHVVLLGQVCSAGTIITMFADSIECDQYLSFMIHQASSGSYGIMSHITDHVSHISKLCTSVLKDAYKGFLSDSEMQEVLNGKELWLEAKEVEQRFNSRLAAVGKITNISNYDEQEFIIPDEVINKLTKDQLKKIVKGELALTDNLELIEV